VGAAPAPAPVGPVAQKVTAATSAPEEMSAPARKPMDPAMARMLRLARVWGEVRYRHPYLWEGRGIDWDAALVDALPRMEAARTDADERAVLRRMLDALHDPLTTVVTAPPWRAPGKATATAMATAGSEPAGTTRSWEDKKTLVLRLGPKAELGDAKTLRTDILAARTLVVDLRAGANEGEGDGDEQARALERLADVLVSRPCASPARRAVFHGGYRSQRGAIGEPFFSGAVEASATSYPAGKREHPLQVVALVRPSSVLPQVLLAMQRAGDARIVSEGELLDPVRDTPLTVPLPSGVLVTVRTEEMTTPVKADLVVRAAAAAVSPGTDPALDAARKLGRSPLARKSPAPPPLPPIAWQPDAEYANDAYPSRELRELALVRFWNVIRLFYPARHLIESTEHPWDDVLTEFLPRMQAARNAEEYTLAVAALSTQLHDSHTWVESPEMGKFFGRPMPGLEVRRIEARPIVTALTPAQAAAGLQVGDELVAIDGEPFASRVARLEPYVAASNEWTLARDAYRWALHGREKEAAMQVRNADGRVRELHVARGVHVPPSAPSPSYELLESGTIGYVDLSKLTQPEVDPMFAALGATRAIIFDMRGYPRNTMQLVARRMSTRPGVRARFVTKTLGLGADQDALFNQELLEPSLPTYRGPTVMLIDERTQSQAEHTGLAFEASNGAKFIGSPSAGANGNVTQTTLPGGIAIGFSGFEVLHADGRQLQRVGLQPDVPVTPTVAGIRAGRDEVLERALVYVKDLADRRIF
jgi:C-terminal processing protease CtpA/Prc